MKIKAMLLALLMTMQIAVAQDLVFQPTTTLANITANNTSAADSFPGWTNNVAKPGPVSNVPMALNPGQETYVHMVPWWGSASHPSIGYTSYDPVYVQRLAADLTRRHITGATWLWNGTGGVMDKSCLAMKPAFEQAGLKFATMLSATIPTLQNATTVSARTTAMKNIMAYLRTNFLKSPAQLRVKGRPVILFFGLSNSDYDWNAVRAYVHTFGTDEPLFYFRFEKGYGQRAVADGYFGWTDDSESWITAVKALGKDIIFGLNGGFNNSLAPWAKTSKIINQNGGQTFQNAVAVYRNHPEITKAQIATWNDYQEGSEVETGLSSGTILATTLVDNKLTWSGTTGALDHTNVYISQDGTALMPLATMQSSTTWLDLTLFKIPFGTWYFVVESVGQPMVQNSVSNEVRGSLNWTVQ